MGAHGLTRRWTRFAALALVTAIATTACTGGGGDGKDEPTAESKASASPRLPPKPDLPDPVDTRGPVTEPLMEPVWLIRSTKTDESEDYDVRTQGLFVDGDVAVYQAQDTMFGISMADGSTVWKSPVDMHGELPSYAGTAPHGDHRWSFVYPETEAVDFDESGDHLVTVDTQTGEVVADTAIGTYGAVTAMGSAKGKQYVATEDGLGRVEDDGSISPVVRQARLPGREPEIVRISPIEDSDVISLAIDDDDVIGTDLIIGADSKSGDVLWQHPVTDFAKGKGADYVDLSDVDGRYVTREAWDRNSVNMRHLWTLDPATGKVLAHYLSRPGKSGADYHQMRIGVNDIGVGNPHGMVVVGDDIVFEDSQGVSRFSPLTGKYVWTLRRDLMGLRHGDAESAGFGIGGTSPDRTLLYTFMSSGRSGDLMAVDLKTGELAGRWALDDAQQAGLVGRPLMVVDGNQVVLARNRSIEGDPELLADPSKPLGPSNDVGLLLFPDLGGKQAS
jgi:outer membrane protein assembly factor BamB